MQKKKIRESFTTRSPKYLWQERRRETNTTYPLGNKQDYESRANFIFQYGSIDFHLSILFQDYLLYFKLKKTLNKNIIAKKSKYTNILFVLIGKQTEIQKS